MLHLRKVSSRSKLHRGKRFFRGKYATEKKWPVVLAHMDETRLMDFNDIDIVSPIEEKTIEDVKVPQIANYTTAIYKTNVFFDRGTLTKIPSPQRISYENLDNYVPPSKNEKLLNLAKQESCKYLTTAEVLGDIYTQFYLVFTGIKDNSLFGFLSHRYDKILGRFSDDIIKGKTFVVRPVGGGKYAVDNVPNPKKLNKASLDIESTVRKMIQFPRADIKKYIIQGNKDIDKILKDKFNYRKIGNIAVENRVDAYDDVLKGNFNIHVKPTKEYLENDETSQRYFSKISGTSQSMESECVDLVRNDLLSIYFQNRFGDFKGSYVTYHNSRYILGTDFMYNEDMEHIIIETERSKDVVWKVCNKLFNVVFDYFTTQFPDKTLEISFRNHNSINIDTFALTIVVKIVENDDGYTGYNPGDPELLNSPEKDYSNIHYYKLNTATIINSLQAASSFMLTPEDFVEVKYNIDNYDENLETARMEVEENNAEKERMRFRLYELLHTEIKDEKAKQLKEEEKAKFAARITITDEEGNVIDSIYDKSPKKPKTDDAEPEEEKEEEK
eukprot:TRINITY_DN5722_c0_g1_i1.p1 TRINITY_DN5722_c0_g1~~TRINITY_DN5722_c0_g1_i1.p1  ORF type:complete len:556 (+),score=121.66 TRINITY_DN5722_c0_g1_i1:34-1701(+)